MLMSANPRLLIFMCICQRDSGQMQQMCNTKRSAAVSQLSHWHNSANEHVSVEHASAPRQLNDTGTRLFTGISSDNYYSSKELLNQTPVWHYMIWDEVRPKMMVLTIQHTLLLNIIRWNGNFIAIYWEKLKVYISSQIPSTPQPTLLLLEPRKSCVALLVGIALPLSW